MRPPRFWDGDIDPRSREAAPLTRFLLSPFAMLYAQTTARRIANAEPLKLSIPVICAGNLTVGGTGKSPVAAALRRHFSDWFPNRRVATLSRGYGGRLKGPLHVDLATHDARDVGDEALMLAARGEAWIGADRREAGRCMMEAGVDLIIMDDGHQNPGLFKDVSLIVVDSNYGFGNGHVIPKGPLREPVEAGLSRAHAIILTGDGEVPAALDNVRMPILRTRITVASEPAAGPLVAFAGIGRPEKFFDTLETIGRKPVDAVPFPDHHVYSASDLRYLRALADKHGAVLITTEKDFARLGKDQRADILTLPVEAQFTEPEKLDHILAPVAERLQT